LKNKINNRGNTNNIGNFLVKLSHFLIPSSRLRQKIRSLLETIYLQTKQKPPIRITTFTDFNFEQFDYFVLHYDWQSLWDEYIQKHDLSSKIKELQNGMDDISKEYINKYVELISLLKYKDSLLLKTNFVWTTYDYKLAEYIKEFSNGFKSPYNTDIDISLYTTIYGIINLPETVRNSINGKTIIDGGGYSGDSAIMFHYYFPDSPIDIFEPLSLHTVLIRDTLQKTGINKEKINIIQNALGDISGRNYIYFLEETADQGASLTSIKANQQSVKSELVQITTLDEYTHGKQIGLIKLDVEGFESRVIKGGLKFIKEQKPILIISLYHSPFDFFEIKGVLESLDIGYKFMIRRIMFILPLVELSLIAY
jgi:FkbM family methyltransferase